MRKTDISKYTDKIDVQPPKNQSGAKKVLRAAALTYVAALLMSALQLLRYVLIFVGRSGRRGGGRE